MWLRLIFPPCGVPTFVGWYFPFSITPLSKNLRINDTASPSFIVLLIMFISLSWFTVLWPLLTSCDKPFPTEKTFSSARPPEVRHLTFLFYSLNLLHKVTHIFWTLACLVALSAYTALILSSCSSSQDFATHFLHFHLTMDSLCFTNGWLICTPITDFHRQVKCHARHTKNRAVVNPI